MALRTVFLLCANIILFTSNLMAQSVDQLVCAWEVQLREDYHGRFLGLDLFNGTYRLVSIEDDQGQVDNGNYGRAMAAGNLETLVIPKRIGYKPSGWFGGPNLRYSDMNNIVGDGSGSFEVRWTDQKYFFDILGLPDELKKDDSLLWCTNKDSGYFFFRGAIQRDLRFTSGGFFDVIGGIIGVGDPKEYAGIRVVPLSYHKGVDLPVARFAVTDASAAQRAADDFYTNLDAGSSQNYATFELRLWGQIRRSPTGRHYQTCTKEWSWSRLSYVRKCTSHFDYPYQRTLIGELRYISYMDPRVGVPGHDPARVESHVRVVFSGDDLFYEDPKAMEALRNQIRAFCNQRIEGCGTTPSHLPALGVRWIRGSDYDLRMNQMCKAALKKNFGVTVNDCTSPNNPFAPTTDVSQKTLEDALRDDNIEPITLSREESNLVREGVRNTGDGYTYYLPGSRERYCLQRAQRDSAAIMNGPVPVGEPDPTPVSARVLYEQCLRELGIEPRPKNERPKDEKPPVNPPPTDPNPPPQPPPGGGDNNPEPPPAMMAPKQLLPNCVVVKGVKYCLVPPTAPPNSRCIYVQGRRYCPSS